MTFSSKFGASIVSFSLLCASCHDDELLPEAEIISNEGFIVGFDQCAPFKGRIIAVANPPDTIVTYNFPDSLYSIPDSLFIDLQLSCFFEEEVHDRFPVHIKYRAAEQEEFSQAICFSTIDISKLTRIVRQSQVVIIAAEK